MQKQVTNGTSTGPFTVRITCSTTGVGSPSTQDLVFNALDANGQQTITRFFDTDPLPLTCSITEPVSAGATSVTIECVTPPSGVACTAPASALTVNVPSGFDDFVDLRVTNDFTPTTVPGPVTNVVARLGSVIVSWTAPASTGGSPITGYLITQLPGGAHFQAAATATSIEIPCPAPGTYRYTVQAQNANGSSAPAFSNFLDVPPTCDGSPVTAVVAAPTFTG